MWSNGRPMTAPTFNLADLFEQSVDAWPDRDYIVAGDVRRTYGEMEARANQLAHHLAANGVKQGDHVGIYALNCAEWVETLWAVFKLRAVWVNINYEYMFLVNIVEKKPEATKPHLPAPDNDKIYNFTELDEKKFELKGKVVRIRITPWAVNGENLAHGSFRYLVKDTARPQPFYGKVDFPVERAKKRLPGAEFAAGDLYAQPWAHERGRFELVTACEVIYYMADIPRFLQTIDQLGKLCLVTYFAPAARKVEAHVMAMPGAQRTTFRHEDTEWVAVWWRGAAAR